MIAAAIGLVVMIVSELATLARVEPFPSWNTPICWTGFIVFVDGVVWWRRHDSWLQSARREFIAMAALSIPLWLVFEFFNLWLRNWYYVGLPGNTALKYFGYAWSFATIWPAIFEGAELVAVARTAAGLEPGTTKARPAALAAPPAPSTWWITAGGLMLLSPFVVTPEVARYLAAPVWLGFIFLLDPLNARLDAPSLLNEWRSGRRERLVNLLASGFLCGVLWEFWNYWAAAKWHYTVPVMEHAKIFEMPLPGYLGFPAFAVECFTMYVFARALWFRLSRRDGTRTNGRAVAL